MGVIKQKARYHAETFSALLPPADLRAGFSICVLTSDMPLLLAGAEPQGCGGVRKR